MSANILLYNRFHNFKSKIFFYNRNIKFEQYKIHVHYNTFYFTIYIILLVFVSFFHSA